MARKGAYEDASALLFILPFVLSGGYALYLWIINGITATLPGSVYLEVTRNPYLFMAGSFSVMLGLVLGISAYEGQERESAVDLLSRLLQKMAVASFVLSLLAAWYANGFVDISGTALDFVFGRYSIVFPGILLLLSYLVTVPLQVSALKSRRAAGVILMLLVPAVIYEVGKRDARAGIAGGLVLLLLAFAAFVTTGGKEEKGQASA